MNSYLKLLMGFCVLITVFGNGDQECCVFKTVGPHSYELLENEIIAENLGCFDQCVYQRVGVPGSRFCFKKGGRWPVSCVDSLGFPADLRIWNQCKTGVHVAIRSTPNQATPANFYLSSNGAQTVTSRGQTDRITTITVKTDTSYTCLSANPNIPATNQFIIQDTAT